MSGSPDDKKRRFVKIPQTKSTVLLNIVLAVGLLLLTLGLILMLWISFQGWDKFPFFYCFSFVAGLLLIFLVFAVSKSGALLSAGIILASLGVMGMVCRCNLVPYSVSQFWPSVVIASGISVFLSGLYKMKKIRSWYLFPSIFLVILGIVFFLFSFDVITMSFSAFVGRWWPLLIILVGIILITVFIVQQRHHKEFPYMEDDSSESYYSGE